MKNRRCKRIAFDHEEPYDVVHVKEKVRWLSSPLIEDGEHHHQPKHASSPASHSLPGVDGSSSHKRVDKYDGYPPFRRYEDVNLLEIFYDLFFAANYNVFSQNQTVTNHQRFKAYIGYFSLLWGTWFVVTLFDVRFVTDSLFERMTRAIQLGVLVGFAVVAPNFDPEKQHKDTMKTMSLILCFSRFCLAVEYGTTYWRTRMYHRARTPLLLQILLNVATGAIYLGVTFRFQHYSHSDHNSRVFITWYVVAAGEAILTIVLSNFWRTLSFTRTHLMKRMSLLTVMILGDGIVSIAQNVVVIVKRPDAWNSFIIGLITAATATVYFMFLVYFDWMRHSHLPALRQQIWTILHYPFHLALVLFMQGFTQFIIWGKVMSVFKKLTDTWFADADGELDSASPAQLKNITSKDVASLLTNQTDSFFKMYPPTYYQTWDAAKDAITNISTINDGMWTFLAEYDEAGGNMDINDTIVGDLFRFGEQYAVVISSMANGLFNAFGIDLITEQKQKYANETSAVRSSQFQISVSDKTTERYRLVFAYTYVSCGCALFFLASLAALARMRPWTAWPVLRMIAIVLVALGTALGAILFYSPDKADEFLASPWPLPAITFVWLLVAVVTHIHGRSDGSGMRYRIGNLFGRGRRGKDGGRGERDDVEYDAVAIPMSSWQDEHGKEQVRDTETDLKLPAAGAESPPQEQLLRGHAHGSSETSAGEYNHEHPAMPMAYDPLRQSSEYNGIGTAR